MSPKINPKDITALVKQATTSTPSNLIDDVAMAQLVSLMHDADATSFKELLKDLKPHIKNKDWKKCMAAIHVLKTLVDECSDELRMMVASEEWMRRLGKILTAQGAKEPALRNMVLQTLSDWKDVYGGNPRMQYFNQKVEELQSKGVNVPVPSPEVESKKRARAAQGLNNTQPREALFSPSKSGFADRVSCCCHISHEELPRAEALEELRLLLIATDPAKISQNIEVLREYIAASDFDLALSALTVIDELVRRCPNLTALHFDVASEKWTSVLIHRVKDTQTDPRVRDKILQTIVNWAEIFKSNPDLQGIQQANTHLTSSGIIMPAVNIVDTTPKKSAEKPVPVIQPLPSRPRNVPAYSAKDPDSFGSIDWSLSSALLLGDMARLKIWNPIRAAADAESRGAEHGGFKMFLSKAGLGDDMISTVGMPSSTVGVYPSSQSGTVSMTSDKNVFSPSVCSGLEAPISDEAIRRAVDEWQQRYNSTNAELQKAKKQIEVLQSDLSRATADVDRARAAAGAGEEVAAEFAAEAENRRFDAERKIVISEKENQQLKDSLKSLEVEAHKLRSNISESVKVSDKHVEKLTSELALQTALVIAEQNSRAETERKLSLIVEEKTALVARVSNVESDSFRQTGLRAVVAVRSMKMSTLGMKSDIKSTVGAINSMFSQLNVSLRDWVKMSENMFENTVNEREELRAMYRAEVARRKILFNQLQELRGNLRVYCRVRPLLSFECERGDVEDVMRISEDDDMKIEVMESRQGREGIGRRIFEYDKVFGQNATQANVFEETSPLITSVLDGYNVCIFAYGQTGSGKTYTMQGDSEQPGVNARAMARIFGEISQRIGVEEVQVELSVFEIYNEEIRDLLDAKNKDKKFNIRLSKEGMVFVEGLTREQVRNVEEVMRLVTIGGRNRAVGVTKMNEHSSRSHLLLSLYIISRNVTSGDISSGKLHLIDLAGSERLSKSESSGQRALEARAINKSLSALGDVVSSLAKNNSHIPYRNSKLTYVLQDSIGGDSKTLMFVNLSPASDNIQESLCSLKFASLAKDVVSGPAQKHVVKGAAPPANNHGPDDE